MKQKVIIWGLTGIMLATRVSASLTGLREHVDIHWTYDSGEGWTCFAKTEGGGEDVFQSLDNVFLPLDDSPWESGGQRYIQPPGETYAFTGVEPDGPIWIAPQIQLLDQAWPGFNNDQAVGTFGSYQETDPRLSVGDRALSLPWITLSLQSVAYQGPGSGAFSLWQSDAFGTPTRWLSTVDSAEPDTFPFVAGSHVHLNWGFGSPGIYRIRLSAAAFLGPGKTNPTDPSASYTVTFAVGPFAQWQAEHFTAAELDDASISGADADPDRDGLKNLTEFAFGMHPKDATRSPLAPGLGLPVFSIVQQGGNYRETLTYPRRRAGEQFSPLSYVSQFSHTPASGWTSANVVETAADFTGDEASLNAVWEKVTASRPVGTSLPPGGFARIKLEE